jgi:hypothetical protein
MNLELHVSARAAIIYNRAVRNKFLIPVAMSLLGAAGQVALSQTPAPQPQVRVNYLNACSPGADDSQQIAGTLERIAARPRFAPDFEVSRGRSTVSSSELLMQGEDSSGGPSVSDWVRIRREFPPSSPFINVQYSFSINQDRVVETLTFRAREAKDILQVSITDSVNSPRTPAQVARLNTPAERIRVERFGKPSIVLARCPNEDQAKFETLFSRATALLAGYRSSLRVPTTVPAEIARLPNSNAGGTAKHGTAEGQKK